MVILVNIIGLILILAIIVWFWLIKPKAKKLQTEGEIEIRVENGVYDPAVIQAKAGQTVRLKFLRKDATPCSAVVVFDGLDISQELPIDKPHIITIESPKPGTYPFACQMKMYQGKLIVE